MATMATCPAMAKDGTNQSLWSYCPSLAAAYLFAIFFLLSAAFHLYQAIRYRKPYCFVIITAVTLQCIAFIFRIISINNGTVVAPYAISFVLILVAPVWTNAFVYMVLGRMIYNFIPSGKVFGLRGWRFGIYFVLLDITSVPSPFRSSASDSHHHRAFLVQVFGASRAVGNNVPEDQLWQGLHIYMGGIGIQQLFILVFLVMVTRFHQLLLLQPKTTQNLQAKRLLCVVYISLTLITIRIIVRLLEYSQSLDGVIATHEAFLYCLDSSLMLICALMFSLIHPGKVMPGSAGNFPSRKDRRAIKAAENSFGSQPGLNELLHRHEGGAV
ncbi:MAG: hypothetical protein M1838_001119 [Thelocarpon superellum]|nr:MAG: hypothetical protein M1838_001119 [Thelocarpon superellum]